MNRRMALALLGALMLGTALAGCEGAQNDAAFGQKVRAYLLEHPEVIEEAVNRLNARKEATAAAETGKRLVAYREALAGDARDPVLGARSAPITVVEFFDYRCGYCKASAPEVLALVEQNRDVRLVMKEYPILSPESEYAARVALVAAKQGKYAPVHRALMAERAINKASVDRIAKANGVDVSGANAGDVTEHLTAVQNLAASLQVGGTPAFVVGEQMIPGADMAALQAAIAAERRRTSGRAEATPTAAAG